MRSFGTTEDGFSIEAEEGGSRVRLIGWGFWAPDLAALFAQESVEACRGRPVQILLDVARLKPQSEQGQAAFRTLMTFARSAGIQRAVAIVGGNVITKMQLMRIAKHAGALGWAYVATETAAAS